MTKATFTFTDAAKRMASHIKNNETAGLKAPATIIAYLATHGAGDATPAETLAHYAGRGRGDVAASLPKEAAALRYECSADEVHAKGHKQAHYAANRIAYTWRNAVQLMAGVVGWDPKFMRDPDHQAHRDLMIWCDGLCNADVPTGEGVTTPFSECTLAQAEAYVLSRFEAYGLESVNGIKTMHKEKAHKQEQRQSNAPAASDPVSEEEIAPITPHGPAMQVSELDGLTIKLDQAVERAGAMSVADKRVFFTHMARLAQAGLKALEDQAQEATTNTDQQAKAKAKAQANAPAKAKAQAETNARIMAKAKAQANAA